MNLMLLLDVAPEPSGTGGFSIVLSLLVIVIVVGFTALSLGTLLFILWRKRRGPKRENA